MKKEKAAVQQMNREAAQRYLADISRGLSQEQVQERIDGGWTNKMVTAESKTVGQIVKSNLLTYFNLIFAILAILVIAAGSFRSLNDGTGNERTILIGIHAYYEPEELVGKTCVAIVNLPPRPMMGIESCGMLISAVHHEEGEEKLHLLMLDGSIPAGAKMY